MHKRIYFLSVVAMMSFLLGFSELAAAQSKDSRANSKFYMDVAYPVGEIVPFTGYSLSLGGYSPKGGIKYGIGASSSQYADAVYIEVRLFGGNSFNIPIKIKRNRIDREAIANIRVDGLITNGLKTEIDEALEEFAGDEYTSYSFGFANEWQTPEGLVFGIEWLGYETSGDFLSRVRALQFTIGFGV